MKQPNRRPLSADSVRDHWPNIGQKSHHKPYCIMGALGWYLGDRFTPAFPNPHKAEVLLQKANPNLSDSEAETLAHEIIRSNDRGDTDDAWQKLNKALRRGQ